jgi:hypothetical protein
VPDKVFSCNQSNILLSRQELICTTSWVIVNRVKLSLPQIGNLVLQGEIVKQTLTLPNISSHTLNCLLHAQTFPHLTHPRAYISATTLDFVSPKSNKRPNSSSRKIHPTKSRSRKKVIVPSPTFFEMLTPNHPPPN